MARLIYAFLALSLGTLVAGFLIRDSSIPLLVSIGLSALVLLLILVGTSRRLRKSQALEDEQEELASLEIVEIDPDIAADAEDAAATVATPAATRKPPARRRRATIAEDTKAMDALDTEFGSEETEVTEIVETPPTRSRRKAAKARPPRQKPGTIVEREAPPEFVMDEGEADDAVAEAEPPLTVETPPSRKAARPRRRTAASAEATTPASAVAESTAAIERPVLAPKVWVIPGRSRYHTQDCRFAKGDTLREVTETTAIRRGYVACNVCKPGAG